MKNEIPPDSWKKAVKTEDVTKEEQGEMRQLMSEIMLKRLELNGGAANYPVFASSKKLIPAKDITRIAIKKAYPEMIERFKKKSG